MYINALRNISFRRAVFTVTWLLNCLALAWMWFRNGRAQLSVQLGMALIKNFKSILFTQGVFGNFMFFFVTSSRNAFSFANSDKMVIRKWQFYLFRKFSHIILSKMS